jgi:hypothetical protein
VSPSALESSGAALPRKRIPDSARALSGRSAGKSAPRKVTSRLKLAMDAMAHEGLEMDQAARRAGLTTSAVRKALTRAPVLAYLAAQRKIVRAAEEPRTYKRMIALLHQDRSIVGAVAAGRVLMNAPDEMATHGAGAARAPGVVIVITPPSAAPSAGHVIDVALEEPDER